MRALQDLATSLRLLRRGPGFTLLAVLLLGVGLGLTLYMFGAINGFVLRPLPYRHADRLLHVELSDPKFDQGSLDVPLPDYFAWRDGLRGIEDLAAFYGGTVNLAGDGLPERLDGAFVSGNLFKVLGAEPALGRVLSSEDSRPGAALTALLSHALWTRRFGGDPAILGRSLRLNGRPATVVGVMPPDFRFPYRQEIWLPIGEEAASAPWRRSVTVEVIGHLAPGATRGGVRAELDAKIARLAEADATRPAGMRAVVKPLAEEFVSLGTRRMLGMMFLAVVLVLFIACADVANLLLARGLARRRDLAVRAALGASRARLVTVGLGEALLVAIAASLLGLALAHWAGGYTMSLLRTSADMEIPSWVRFDLDLMTVAVTLALAFATAIAAGLGPALASSRLDVQGGLRPTARGVAGSRLGRGARLLVISQIALCSVLVAGAGLTARSVRALLATDVGVPAERILGARIGLPETSYPDDASRLAFFTRLEEKLRALPGVEAATVTTSLPASMIGGDFIEVEGRKVDERERPIAQIARVSPSYFAAMDVELLSGRGFSPADDAGAAPVTVVNTRLAKALFGSEEPLGRRLRFASAGEDGPWWTIVGVSPDIQQDEIDEPLQPTIYAPLAQQPVRFAFAAVRTAGDARRLGPELQRLVARLDPDLPVYFLQTVAEWAAESRFRTDFLASLFGLFAFAGLALAAAGTYGVLACAVAERTAEIGVRRALGAASRAIAALTAGRTLRDLAWGLGVGLLLAAAALPSLAAEFTGVEPYDPIALAAVPFVLVIATALAAWVPTRRALRVEPAVALRES